MLEFNNTLEYRDYNPYTGETTLKSRREDMEKFIIAYNLDDEFLRTHPQWAKGTQTGPTNITPAATYEIIWPTERTGCTEFLHIPAIWEDGMDWHEASRLLVREVAGECEWTEGEQGELIILADQQVGIVRPSSDLLIHLGETV